MCDQSSAQNAFLLLLIALILLLYPALRRNHLCLTSVSLCLNTQLSEPVCLEDSQTTTIICVRWLGLLFGPPSLTSSVSCRKWRNAWRQNQQQLAEELAATVTGTLCRWKWSRRWGWFWLWITQMPVIAGSGDKWRHMADTYGRLGGLTHLHSISVTTQFMA